MEDTTRVDHKWRGAIGVVVWYATPRSVREDCGDSRHSDHLSWSERLELGKERKNVPTCAPAGVLIRITDPAGAFHARPERMGKMKDSHNVRGACCIESYSCRSTVNGEPAVGRYAGRGVGMGL